MEADQRKPFCPPGATASAQVYSDQPKSSPRQPPPSGRSAFDEAEPQHASPPKTEGFHRALNLLGEYKEYASYYLATKMDGMKGSLRNVGIYAGLGIVGLIAFSAMITTAVALFLIGAAMGLAHLFGEPPKYWLGALVVGLLVLVLIGVGAAVGLSKVNAGFRKAAENKYEQRKRWQRGQFGRDVEQAAATAKKPA